MPVRGSTVPTATTGALGLVKPDGTSLLIDGTGTLSAAIPTTAVAANRVLASAVSGGAAAPSMRALVAADIPNLGSPAYSGLLSSTDAVAPTWTLGLGAGALKSVIDGAITTGTPTLTSATAAFASTDVGKTITVNGAGAGGANLATTILSVTNATTAVLAANASTTVSGATFTYSGAAITTVVANRVRARYRIVTGTTPTAAAIMTVTLPSGLYAAVPALVMMVGGGAGAVGQPNNMWIQNLAYNAGVVTFDLRAGTLTAASIYELGFLVIP